MLKRTLHASARGFTLIEMAITMAIFGFLLAAAMPSIGVWLDNTRIRTVAESIQAGLQTARAEAVRRNQSMTFWLVQLDDPNALTDSCDLSSTSGSWVVSVNAPNGHCGAAPSTTDSPMLVTGRPVGDSGSHVTVSAVQSDGTAGLKVTFNGFGRVANTDAISTVSVTGQDTSRTDYRRLQINISGTGMVRMCDPGATSSDDPRKC